MITVEPANVPLTRIQEAKVVFVYRGLSPQQYHELNRKGFFEPISPLRDTSELVVLFQRERPLEHVLGREGRRFVSFSFQPDTAIYYATHGGQRDGYLAEVRLPQFQSATSYSSNKPVVYVGQDGTEWIDPRHLIIVEQFLEWNTMKSRTRVDDEILLAKGQVVRFQIREVQKSENPQDFAPWSTWGEKLILYQHIKRVGCSDRICLFSKPALHCM